MNEIDIIKNIKVDLAKELMEGKYWTADEVLAMVAVYLCPALDSVKLSKDEDLTRKHGTLRDIYKAIKAWGNKRKRHLMEYSRDGLFELFKCEWAAPLSIIEKKRLLNGITLIKSIEDDGHLSYRGNETVYKNLIKTGASSLDLQYGKKEYCPEKKSASTNNEETTMKSNRQEAYVQEEKLKNVWSKISGQPDYKEKMPLIWKLCIPYQIYMQLKESLTEYLQTTSEKPRVILKKHAEKILVYVALWYRWGYKGGGNQENALDVLGNTRIKINHVWNNCSDIQKYLYKTEDSTSYLYSAYVLGGFPLQYINDSGRFDSLFQKIYSLDENAITEEGMKEVSDAFDQNNATYTQSFQQGSFREYVTSLLHDEETIAEEDNDNALVARYRQLIKNGKIERNNKIFHHEWLYYINTECESIECYFKLKIGCKNMYITPPKGVGIDVSDFFIGIETDNGKASRQRIRFSRINDDTFMGWGNIDMLEMNVPQLAVNKINVCIYTGEDAKDKKIVETIPTPDCIQLYNTKKPYEWSSDKSKKTVVFPAIS